MQPETRTYPFYPVICTATYEIAQSFFRRDQNLCIFIPVAISSKAV